MYTHTHTLQYNMLRYARAAQGRTTSVARPTPRRISGRQPGSLRLSSAVSNNNRTYNNTDNHTTTSNNNHSNINTTNNNTYTY